MHIIDLDNLPDPQRGGAIRHRRSVPIAYLQDADPPSLLRTQVTFIGVRSFIQEELRTPFPAIAGAAEPPEGMPPQAQRRARDETLSVLLNPPLFSWRWPCTTSNEEVDAAPRRMAWASEFIIKHTPEKDER